MVAEAAAVAPSEQAAGVEWQEVPAGLLAAVPGAVSGPVAQVGGIAW